jgi:hypothetical protein
MLVMQVLRAVHGCRRPARLAAGCWGMAGAGVAGMLYHLLCQQQWKCSGRHCRRGAAARCQLHRVQLMQVGGEWQAAHEAGIAEGQAQAAAPAQHPRQLVQHRGQVGQKQGVDRQRGIHRGIGDRQRMGVASHRGTVGQPGAASRWLPASTMAVDSSMPR